jgi:hypothetical protein
VTFPYIGFSPPEMVVKQTQTQLTLLPTRIQKRCAYVCWNKHVCSRTQGDKNTSQLGPLSAHTQLCAPSILCPHQTLSIVSPSSIVPHPMAMLSTDSAHIVRPRCPLSQCLRLLTPMPPMHPWCHRCRAGVGVTDLRLRRTCLFVSQDAATPWADPLQEQGLRRAIPRPIQMLTLHRLESQTRILKNPAPWSWLAFEEG